MKATDQSIKEAAERYKNYQDYYDNNITAKISNLPAPDERYMNYVLEECRQLQLPPPLPMVVITLESGWVPSKVNNSSGAAGMMQIMPDIGAAKLKQIYPNFRNESDDNVKAKLLDAQINIHLGCTILRELANRYSGNISLILSGYNGGAGFTDQWIKIKNPLTNTNFPYYPSRETIGFVEAGSFIYKGVVERIYNGTY